MKILKTKNGWLNLEKNGLNTFGNIAIQYYNYLKNKKSILHQETTTSDEKLDAIDSFLNVIDDYLSDQKGYQPTYPFELYSDCIYTIEEQTIFHKQIISLAQDNGWKNIPEDINLNSIDVYLMQVFANAPPLQTSMHFYDGEWCIAYDFELEFDKRPSYNEVENGKTIPEWLVFLDMIEMRNNDYNFCYCEQCKEIYVKRRKNNRLCDTCGSSYKKIYDKVRSSTPKGKIDKVCNYMRNSLKYTNDEIITFREDANQKLTSLNEEKFNSWCDEKHKMFKADAKIREKI